jgi:hypothetical protein
MSASAAPLTLPPSSQKALEAGLPVFSEFSVKDDIFAWFGGMSPVEEAQFLYFAVDGVLLGRTGMERISTDWLSGPNGVSGSLCRS